jgi:hypothetical protein
MGAPLLGIHVDRKHEYVLMIEHPSYHVKCVNFSNLGASLFTQDHIKSSLNTKGRLI